VSFRLTHGRGILPVLLILGALGYWWIHSRPTKVLAVAYVADRNLILWNTLAQVRQPVAELHYGDRVEILGRDAEAARVRTAAGVLGWLPDSGSIMDSALWQKSANLLARARALPVQARGRTKTVTNVRIEPGRTGSRIFQFTRGTPVVVLERAVADLPVSPAQPGDVNTEQESTGGEEPMPRREDWLLVLRAGKAGNGNEAESSRPGAATARSPASSNPVSGGQRSGLDDMLTGTSQPIAVAGWVLRRFIELDPPAPVKDYASSADLRVVAWFELNRVPDGSGGEAPQYLVAGAKGGDGQACDFTMLRVYTWGAVRQRYETAYVESNLCGRLPIRLSQTPAGPEFRFAEARQDSGERQYVLRQTVVRRIRNERSQTSRRER
jgi:hypothetical protein